MQTVCGSQTHAVSAPLKCKQTDTNRGVSLQRKPENHKEMTFEHKKMAGTNSNILYEAVHKRELSPADQSSHNISYKEAAKVPKIQKAIKEKNKKGKCNLIMVQRVWALERGGT